MLNVQGRCPGQSAGSLIKQSKMLKAPSQITKVQTLADRTLKLDVHVNRELSAEDELELMRLRQKEGWLVFSINDDIQESDIPTDPVESNHKTPAQRLHNVLAVYKQKLDKAKNKVSTATEIRIFYENQIERLIEHYKQKIQELEN